MQAILIVAGTPEDIILRERYNTAMLPLVDRPFLRHVVEYLVEQGIVEFDFVISQHPEKVESLFGDGSRWGSVFRYHLAPTDDAVYSSLAFVPTVSDTPILLVHADRLPQVDVKEAAKEGSFSAPILYFQTDGNWSGWGILPVGGLDAIAGVRSEYEMAIRLMEGCDARMVPVAPILEVGHFAGLLDAQRRVASGAFQGLQQTGRITSAVPESVKDPDEHGSPSIRLGRGASVAPDTILIPPVFVGENSHIGAGCRIGPNVVISDHCIVGENTQIAEALLLPGSLAGDGLELCETIVDRGRMVSVRHGDGVTISDTFLLGDLEKNPMTVWASRTQSRVAAVCLILALWPLLLFTAMFLVIFRPGPLFYRHTYVSLPTTADMADWRTFTVTSFHSAPHNANNFSHFFQCFLPGLFAVGAGHLRLVGVTPRTPAVVQSLPSDRRALYLRGKAGLISETRVVRGIYGHLEEELMTEGLYAVVATPAYDLRLLLRYFGQCFVFTHDSKPQSAPPEGRTTPPSPGHTALGRKYSG